MNKWVKNKFITTKGTSQPSNQPTKLTDQPTMRIYGERKSRPKSPLKRIRYGVIRKARKTHPGLIKLEGILLCIRVCVSPIAPSPKSIIHARMHGKRFFPPPFSSRPEGETANLSFIACTVRVRNNKNRTTPLDNATNHQPTT